MFMNRPEITDDATAQRVLGISLMEYARKVVHFERKAIEAVAKRHEHEWTPWLDEARKLARKDVQNMQEEGWKSFVSEWRGKADYKNEVGKLESKRIESILRNWTSKPKDYVAAKELVWKEQWDNDCSDFWRQRYVWRVVYQVSNLRFDGDEEKAAAALWELDGIEVSNEFEPLLWGWLDDLIKAKKARADSKALSKKKAKSKPLHPKSQPSELHPPHQNAPDPDFANMTKNDLEKIIYVEIRKLVSEADGPGTAEASKEAAYRSVGNKYLHVAQCHGFWLSRTDGLVEKRVKTWYNRKRKQHPDWDIAANGAIARAQRAR